MDLPSDTHDLTQCMSETDICSKSGTFSIECLPLELLMHICSFLDARYVIRVVSRVSKAFHDIITVDSYWKARITKRWPKQYPAIPDDEADIDWRTACIEREDQFTMWSNQEETTLTFSYDCDMFASVDCVHLMNNAERLVAGSRDRYLNIIDVTKMTHDTIDEPKAARIHSEANAHKGWIWCLASDGDGNIYSGSWDRYLKQWDLTAGCVEVNKYKCKSAVLDIVIQPGLIAAATYAKLVYTIDPRVGTMTEHKWHKKPILSLALTSDYIISCSEDSTINFYDRRAAAISDTITLQTYGICMSLTGNELWVGDKTGLVHLIDARPTHRAIVETYDVGHREKITGIQHTLGALYTCSTDGLLRVHEPNRDPAAICCINTLGQLSALHYQNGVLATAGPKISVSVIKPKTAMTY